MIKKVALVILLLTTILTGWQPLEAQTAPDPIRISLLTCSPSREVYGLFGHTAIRVQDTERNIDIVFNYGMFSFSTPHFIYRFTKGETDYSLGVENFKQFIMQYGMDDLGVVAQEINLSPEESRALLNALIENSRPENRVYRYNYIYDNCTTRAHAMIAKHLGETIDFQESNTAFDTTYRKMIHYRTKNDPWLTVGIDLLLGSPLDKPLSYQEGLFLPRRLEQAFAKADIERNDTIMPLVKSTETLLSKGEVVIEKLPWFALPPVALSLLLVLTILLSIIELLRGKVWHIIDTVVYGIYGLVGCLLCFMMFVSTHPATFPNYSIIWVQPLHLLVAIGVWIPTWRGVLNYYYVANIAALLLLLVGWNMIPQVLNAAFIPLVLILLTRSLLNTIVYEKDTTKSKKRKRQR